MPEITAIETIRNKLRDFDQHMDGAISAAKTINRIKGDAEKLLTGIQNFSTKGELLIKRIEYIESEFEKSQQDWKTLKQEIDDSLAESAGVRDGLCSEFNSAIRLIEEKLLESENSLKEENKKSLMEQVNFFKSLG